MKKDFIITIAVASVFFVVFISITCVICFLRKKMKTLRSSLKPTLNNYPRPDTPNEEMCTHVFSGENGFLNSNNGIFNPTPPNSSHENDDNTPCISVRNNDENEEGAGGGGVGGAAIAAPDGGGQIRNSTAAIVSMEETMSDFDRADQSGHPHNHQHQDTVHLKGDFYVNADRDSDDNGSEGQGTPMFLARPNPFSRMKSYSVGCYPMKNGEHKGTPYMKCPEDVNQNGIHYNYDDVMVQESALCDSYTKLKMVYDLQSEGLPQRTVSCSDSGDNNYNTEQHYSGEYNDDVDDEALAPYGVCDNENTTGFDRAKFLYDRICKTMPSMSVSSDLNAGHKTPPITA